MLIYKYIIFILILYVRHAEINNYVQNVNKMSAKSQQKSKSPSRTAFVKARLNRVILPACSRGAFELRDS